MFCLPNQVLIKLTLNVDPMKIEKKCLGKTKLKKINKQTNWCLIILKHLNINIKWKKNIQKLYTVSICKITEDCVIGVLLLSKTLNPFHVYSQFKHIIYNVHHSIAFKSYTIALKCHTITIESYSTSSGS